MSLSNLNFSLIFIHQRYPLYICQHNLQKAMDKEDFRSIAGLYTFLKLCSCYGNLEKDMPVKVWHFGCCL